MSFSDKLYELRTSNGISQKDLANGLGVAQSSINYWEKGQRDPSITVVKKIADYFGVSLDYLIDFDSEPANIDIGETELVRKYRTLDADGKETVDFILNKEYKRCLDGYLIKTQNGITYVEKTHKKQSADRVTAYVNAAHADDYANAPEELKKQEEDIMDDENF